MLLEAVYHKQDKVAGSLTSTGYLLPYSARSLVVCYCGLGYVSGSRFNRFLPYMGL